MSIDSRKIFLIKLLRGSKVIRVYKIASDSVTIGSDPSCTIRMAGDREAFPIHATLYQEDGEITIVPESRALVLRNNEPIDFGLMEPEDVAKIGKLSFRAELVDATNSVAPNSGRQSIAPEAVRPQSAPPGTPTTRQMSSSKAPTPIPRPSRSAKPSIQPLRVSQSPARNNGTFQATEPPSKTVPKETDLPVPSVVPSSFVPDPLGIPEEINIESAPTEAVPPSVSIAEDILETLEDIDAIDVTTSFGMPVPDSTSQWVDSTADDYFFDDNDDPGENEYFFTEPFNLTQELLQGAAPNNTKVDDHICAGNVLRIQNQRIVDTEYVRPGRAFRSSFDNIRCKGNGPNVTVIADAELFETIKKGDEFVNVADYSNKKGRVKILLSNGDYAVLHGTGGTYRIEVYHPPVAPPKESIGFNSSVLAILAGAIILHATFGLLAWVIFPDDRRQEDTKDEEIYAVVEMEKPEFKKHKDDPTKPEPKPVPKDATAMAERAPQVSTRTVKRIRERATTAKTSSSVNSLLNILSKGSGKPGKTDNIKDLVSNIDAVGVGSGSAAYNIAGAIGELPGGDVNVARQGGGGAANTLSGEQIAGANSKIAQLTRKKPSGKIRGKVTKMSSGARVKGSLSKEDVSRVVNSHIHAVQACYEKALLSNPGLSGRIVFDWTVKINGRVSGVRVRSSTLTNSAVSTCIANKIKKWKFPRPTGGEVVITYPFLFRSVSS